MCPYRHYCLVITGRRGGLGAREAINRRVCREQEALLHHLDGEACMDQDQGPQREENAVQRKSKVKQTSTVIS